MNEQKAKKLRKEHQEVHGNSKALRYKRLPNGQIVADSNRWYYQKKKGRRGITPATRVVRV